MRRVLVVFALLTLIASGATAAPRLDHLSIYVPSSPNGGFDRTAVAIRRTLLDEGLVRQVDLVRSPGAGGLVALAQFSERQSDTENRLIIGGQTILGATRYNRSQVSLRNIVPVARLNAIAVVIAVRADSPIRNWQDIAGAMQTDPDAVKWVGGSEGSVDTQLLTILANQLHIARNKISYLAIPGGGDAVVEKILDGSHVATISSYEEVSDYLGKGQMRAIAVASERPVAGLETATLKAQGLDVAFTDWKGVFAPRGTSDERQRQLAALFAELAKSDSWREELRAHRWEDNFQTGPAFSRFVEIEDTKLAKQIYQAGNTGDAASNIASVMAGPYRYAAIIGLIAFVLLAALSIVSAVNRRQSARREQTLKTALDEKELAFAAFINDGTSKNLADVTKHIDAEFSRWALSETEKDIAWLILKGFSFLEIAELRQRSERTIRQQAGAIYAKSGMRSRAELSAYFLEDLFVS